MSQSFSVFFAFPSAFMEGLRGDFTKCENMCRSSNLKRPFLLCVSHKKKSWIGDKKLPDEETLEN